MLAKSLQTSFHEDFEHALYQKGFCESSCGLFWGAVTILWDSLRGGGMKILAKILYRSLWWNPWRGPCTKILRMHEDAMCGRCLFESSCAILWGGSCPSRKSFLSDSLSGLGMKILMKILNCRKILQRSRSNLAEDPGMKILQMPFANPFARGACMKAFAGCSEVLVRFGRPGRTSYNNLVRFSGGYHLGPLGAGPEQDGGITNFRARALCQIKREECQILWLPDKMSDRMLEKMSKHMPDRTSDPMPDRC